MGDVVKVFGILLIFLLVLFLISMSVYGIYLAFSASLLLGLLALIVEPSPLVFGLVMGFAGVNLPQQIVTWFSNL